MRHACDVCRRMVAMHVLCMCYAMLLLSARPKWGSRRKGVLEPHMRKDMSATMLQLAEQSYLRTGTPRHLLTGGS